MIGFGGGSALDTAKLAALLHTNPGSGPDYEGYERIPDPGLPVIAIPTTAGTGSEVTRGVAITDPDRDVKMLLMSAHLVPAVAIVDPEPTFTMPASVTASTGLDALTHGIEAYVSRRRFPITDALAIDAVDRIGALHIQGLSQPERRRGARGNAGGVAPRWPGLQQRVRRPGARHVAAHRRLFPRTPRTLQRHAAAHCHGVQPQRRHPRASPTSPRVLGATAADDAETAAAGVAIVRDLAADLQVPTLRAWGVDEAHFREVIPAMARDALASGSPANNPRLATLDETVALYEAVIAL